MLDFSERQLIDYGQAIYQTGGRLVHPVRLERDSTNEVDIRRKSGAVVTMEMHRLRLLEFIRDYVKFQKLTRSSKESAKLDAVDYPAPQKIADHILARPDQWKFKVLNGVIEAPTLRADGSLLSDEGYDEQSGLLLDTNGVRFPEIDDLPTKGDAEKALQVLKGPFKDFPFVRNAKGRSASQSVILSAVLTSLVRRSLGSAPMHGTTAPAPGTGKSLLIDVVSLIATGRLCTAMSQGATEEEDEKRLFSLLLQGDPLVMIDNVKRPIEGDALCTILTQATWQCRILGESKKVTVATNATFMASGNNLAFKGDMTTRAILCRIDAKVEKPETRKFKVNLKAEVPKRRTQLVMAGLTVLRAFVVAGRPGLKELTPFGRFEDWSNLVRGALVWLGEPDPCITREYIAQDDSDAGNLFKLLEAMREASADYKTAHELIEEGGFLIDAIRAVAPKQDAISLGRYLKSMENRIVGNLQLHAEYDKSRKTWAYAVRQLI